MEKKSENTAHQIEGYRNSIISLAKKVESQTILKRVMSILDRAYKQQKCTQ